MRMTNKDLEDLYRTFSRAAALVSSLDMNIYAEELCSKLLLHWEEYKNKVCEVLMYSSHPKCLQTLSSKSAPQPGR